MQESTIYIRRIMDTFYKVTDIGSFCFDTHLTLVSNYPDSLSLQAFSCLGINNLLNFLAESFSTTVSTNRYIAYFLHNNIICHITFLARNNKYLGAIVSEPILIKSLSGAELDALSTQFHTASLNKTEVQRFLFKKRTIPYDKALSYGTALHSLCSSLFREHVTPQILKTHAEVKVKSNKQIVVDTKAWNIKGIERHIPSSSYLSIKQSIHDGDTDRIINIIEHNSAANAPMHRLHKTDHVRSIKNSFIKLCTMACYTAIDAGAPYVQTLDIADDMILKMELSDNTIEIYQMMKSMLIEFTRLVSDSKKSIYSQPVRKVMDYLYNHYSDKVTLEDLSNITRFSTYYLSNLIKTETGFSLNDNINKLRIEQSQKILKEKSISILEIAQSVGFRYQNHFAAVFKKYTGITPSEFRHTHGINPATLQPQSEISGKETLIKAIPQMKLKLNTFHGFYDAVRIVDPTEHTSIFLYGNDILNTELICYDFWNKKESCKNCISLRAHAQDDTFFKLEKKDGQTYLLLAFPEHIGKNIYIAELLKDISKQSIINISSSQDNIPLKDNSDNYKDAQTGFFRKYYIDKHLPEEVRKSKAENVPLTLMAATFTLPNSPALISDFISLLADSAISSLSSEDDWIGQYASNAILFVLHNSTEEQAREVSLQIQGKLNTYYSNNDILHFTIQSLSQEIYGAGELLYLLFAKLFGKVQSDT